MASCRLLLADRAAALAGEGFTQSSGHAGPIRGSPQIASRGVHPRRIHPLFAVGRPPCRIQLARSLRSAGAHVRDANDERRTKISISPAAKIETVEGSSTTEITES